MEGIFPARVTGTLGVVFTSFLPQDLRVLHVSATAAIAATTAATTECDHRIKLNEAAPLACSVEFGRVLCTPFGGILQDGTILSSSSSLLLPGSVAPSSPCCFAFYFHLPQSASPNQRYV